MSYHDYAKQVAAMSERDRRIWLLAKKAVNEMGFACQMAEQGAENAQIRIENSSQKAMDELFELLLKTETLSV